MMSSGLILASHGSHQEPAVNEAVLRWALEIEKLGHFQEVVAAFHQGDPQFSSILDDMTSTRVIVVPVMTSGGYYANTVLPEALTRNRRFDQVSITITPPLGTHPGMGLLIRRRIERLLRAQDLSNEQVSVAIVGHGTTRHRHSRNATLRLVDELSQGGLASEVLPAFLDDDPPLETLLSRSTKESILVVPFLISPGPHAMVDLPGRIGMTLKNGAKPPFVEHLDGRLIICDEAVGADPEILSLILDRAGVCVQEQPSRTR